MPSTGVSMARNCSDLAAHLFRLAAAGRHDEVPAYLHPDVEIVTGPDVLSYRDAEGVAHEAMGNPTLTQAVARRFHPVDAERVAVEGQVRTPIAGGGFSETTAAWALVFRDGLLYRSWREPSLDAAIRRLEADRSSSG